MFKFFAVVAALAAVASAATLHPGWSSSGRIVGGNDITIEEVPYQISLQLVGHHYCGASIISKHWVLTAAHCMKFAPSKYSIRAGTKLDHLGGTIHKLAEVIVHENYGVNRYGIGINDIALIRVVEPFEIDETRKPIDLFGEDEETAPATKARITGWGNTMSTPTHNLQTVFVPIVAKSSCNKLYQEYGGLPAKQICAAYPEGGKDSCQGDSGGPLAIDGRQAGVVSWGKGCAEPGYPGVYTEVAAFRAWIKTHSGV